MEDLPVFTKHFNFLPLTFAKSKIPKLLHLIWVGPNEKPETFDKYVKQWSTLMPSWEIRIWENKDINTKEFSDDILQKINESTKGAQKADIMRYSIVEKYGGFYMDADMIPIQSLDPLLMLSEDLIICHDIPITWSYIQMAFFGAVKNHPIIKKACDLCLKVELNTPDIHLKTGPRLFGDAFEKAYENHKVAVLHSTAFYHNKDFTGTKFATHAYAKMW